MEDRKELTIAEFKELNFQIPKRIKYRNKIVIVDGIKFRSIKESEYYGKLKLLKKSGAVTDFKIQVRYKLEVNGIKICTYVADFVVTWKSGKVTVEDTKGYLTEIYKLKRSLMLAIQGITIKEV